jgi:hypothetical protein
LAFHELIEGILEQSADPYTKFITLLNQFAKKINVPLKPYGKFDEISSLFKDIVTDSLNEDLEEIRSSAELGQHIVDIIYDLVCKYTTYLEDIIPVIGLKEEASLEIYLDNLVENDKDNWDLPCCCERGCKNEATVSIECKEIENAPKPCFECGKHEFCAFHMAAFLWERTDGMKIYSCIKCNNPIELEQINVIQGNDEENEMGKESDED